MQNAVFELIKRCSSDLPVDVEEALRNSLSREENGSAAYMCLETILENVEKARSQQVPLCQDTGVLHFYVRNGGPGGRDEINKHIRAAVQQATSENILRPNCVRTLTGVNTGDNTGNDFPHITYSTWDREDIRISLLLKGAGSENVSAQYKLPDSVYGGRDLEGVCNTVLHHIVNIQGRGCAPGILGIGIGGDRGLSWEIAKKQLFRTVEDVNAEPTLDQLETDLLDRINAIGIGPMGLGGSTTILGVNAGCADRHPASYFVTIAYLCWAARRYSMEIRGDGSYDFVT